jgi:hypothetical protein
MQRLLGALVLGTLAVATFTTSAQIFRCRGRIVVAETCCCPHDPASESAAPELRRGTCCESDTLESAPPPPADLTTVHALPALPARFAIAAPPAPVLAPLGEDGVLRPPTGPPLLLAKQSLLI